MADMESLIASYVTQCRRAYAQSSRGIATPDRRAAWEAEARDAIAAHDAEVIVKTLRAAADVFENNTDGKWAIHGGTPRRYRLTLKMEAIDCEETDE